MSGGHEALIETLAAVDGLAEPDSRFEAFLREQREALVQFLRRRTRTEEDAHDAAQESLVKLMRYRASQPAEAWKPLLYRIAENVAHDQSRRAQRRRHGEHVPLDDSVHEIPSEQSPLDEVLDWQRELARIGEVIETLPSRCRDIYLLSRVEGMKNAEIAKHCGISLKAVEKQLTKAMAAVRQALGKPGQRSL